jgi:hypothetical protein
MPSAVIDDPSSPSPTEPSTGDAPLSGWGQRYKNFSESRRGRVLTRVARGLMMAMVFGLLFWQLHAIGWREIGARLPTHPGFYLLFAVIYLQVSFGELLAYRLCWSFDVRASVPVFLKKRILNREILGYSGEVYFFSWARRVVPLPARRIAETIRDQNIVSSIASSAVAVGLLVFYMTHGKLAVSIWLRGQLAALNMLYGLGVAVALLLVAALAYRYRRYLFSMSLKVAGMVLALHVTRLMLGQGIQIFQWELGAPEGTLGAWFTLSTASILANRIPILPSRDLLFVSAGVALASTMQVESAAISGMLLVNAVLAKVVSFGLYTGLSLARGGAAASAEGAAVLAALREREGAGAGEPAGGAAMIGSSAK